MSVLVNKNTKLDPDVAKQVPYGPDQVAKVREVMKVLELYIELPARRHYGELFFGGPRNQAAFEEAKPVLENGVKALTQLCSMKPFLCGEFSLADIVAAHTFIYAAPVCQAIYGCDVVGAIPGLKAARPAPRYWPISRPRWRPCRRRTRADLLPVGRTHR